MARVIAMSAFSRDPEGRRVLLRRGDEATGLADGELERLVAVGAVEADEPKRGKTAAE